MAIKLICAVDSNWAIGNKNQLLFAIPQDLKRFKQLTVGNYTIFGRKSFESVLSYNNGKPLSNRMNVVLTRNRKYDIPLGCFKSDSVQHVINHYNSGSQDKDLYVCGGSDVYSQFMPYADEVLITYIDAEAPQADTYFIREVLEKDFFIGESEQHYCEKNGIDFYYVTYKRK